MFRLTIAAGLSLVSFAASALAASASGDPLAVYENKSRVLAVVAPDASDARYKEQRRLYDAMRSAARERDLVWLEALGHAPAAQALRARFGVEASEFRAILVGKDGGEKLTSDTPIGAQALFPLIDGMPMRQEEMRRSRK